MDTNGKSNGKILVEHSGRRLDMLQSSTASSKHSSSHHHHHRHHHHHHHVSGSTSTYSGSSHHVNSNSSHHNHHSHKHSCKDTCHHTSHSHKQPSSSKQHHYVNAIPFSSSNAIQTSSSSSGSRSNRYINQSDMCTQIISGNLNNKIAPNETMPTSITPVTATINTIGSNSNDCRLSFSSSVSSASASSSSSSSANSSSSSCSNKNSKTAAAIANNNTTTSAPTPATNVTSWCERSTLMSADNSMRCTLRRGRPNTPKTGLSSDYRARKSSVPNTPENGGIKSSLMHMRANNTISNDDMIHHQRQYHISSKSTATFNEAARAVSAVAASNKPIVPSLSAASLNTAIIIQCENDDFADKLSIMTTESAKGCAMTGTNELTDEASDDARLLDMAFTGEDEEFEEDEAAADDVCNEHIDEENQSISSCSNHNDDDDDNDNDESETSNSFSAVTVSSSNLVSQGGRQISLSLSNLPDTVTKTRGSSQEGLIHGGDADSNTSSRSSEFMMLGNRTTVSESIVSEYALVKKSLADFSGSIDQLGACGFRPSSEQALQPPSSSLSNQMEVTVESHSSVNSKTLYDDATLVQKESEPPVGIVPATPALAKTNPIIEEQNKLIQFEPFAFKMPHSVGTPFVRQISTASATSDTKHFELVLNQCEKDLEQGLDETGGEEEDEGQDEASMLKDALRRQSLFKLKERLTGKVKTHINEIEQRKLSPYRFCNSPLKKSKKCKENTGHLSAAVGHISKHMSPVRIPSIFSKKTLTNTPKEQYIINSKSKYISDNKLSKTIASCILDKKTKCREGKGGGGDNSPLIVKAASQFYRRMNRNRSVKRLNASTMSTYTARSNLSAIAENVSMNYGSNNSRVNHSASSFASPTTPRAHCLISTELKCAEESIDF